MTIPVSFIVCDPSIRIRSLRSVLFVLLRVVVVRDFVGVVRRIRFVCCLYWIQMSSFDELGVDVIAIHFPLEI